MLNDEFVELTTRNALLSGHTNLLANPALDKKGTAVSIRVMDSAVLFLL